MLDALAIGAGISGLTLAYRLQQRCPQLQVLVAETQATPGGNISSCSARGYLWEEGPNSFTPSPEILQLAVDVGLRDELVFADGKLPRYVFWQGRLHPVPINPAAAVGSQLLSPWGKIRALAGALGFVPAAASLGDRAEETVAEFFERHLGREVTERLVAPFVSGVYAGAADELSAAAAFARIHRLAAAGGGLVPGALKTAKARKAARKPRNPDLPAVKAGQLCSLRAGLQQLPQAIATELGDAVCYNWTLKALHRSECGTHYRAEFATPEGPQQLETRSVILTTPAHASAPLLSELAPAASQALGEIPYPAVASVILAYPSDVFRQPLDGFGNLIPRGQGIRTLGTIWSSTLFAGRAPAGRVLLSSYIGGATDPELAGLSATEIAAAVHTDLQKTLLAAPVEPQVLNVRLWRQAIPQYICGHHDRLARAATGLEELPGLHLCANYLDGVALGDCVRRAEAKAEAIAAYLERAPLPQ